MRRIVLVEDDRDTLDLIDYVLSEKGYEVIASSSGELVDLVNQLRPDLILLDSWTRDSVRMQLVATIKQSANRHIPVILTSTAPDIEAEAREFGADAFLAKPFDLDYLEKLVENTLKR